MNARTVTGDETEPAVLGREPQLGAVARLADEVAEGPALAFGGEIGIGTTTVRKAGVACAGERGFTVLKQRPNRLLARRLLLRIGETSGGTPSSMARGAASAGPLGAGLLIVAAIGFGVEAHAMAARVEGGPRAVVGSETNLGALSADQQELVDLGSSRFEAQGLLLPEIQFEFFPTALDCGGHLGRYYHRTNTLQMCSLDEGTMLHELAHAWSHAALTEHDKRAFMKLRGLESWDDRRDPWRERGAEQAAEIIAWALRDTPNTFPDLTGWTDGSTKPEFRLLSIDNSSAESLHEAFVVLTGMEPVLRTRAEWDSERLYANWQARMTTTSPEARRQ